MTGRRKQEPRTTDSCHDIRTRRATLLLGLVALVLQSLVFEPIAAWPFAFICLVPWAVMVGRAARARWAYFATYLCAVAFHLINMRWLYPATHAGFYALSAYQSIYFVLVAWPLRHAVRNRGWPFALALPIVWVASEILRAVILSGFPWFFLSHGMYKVLPFIQVSDLVGAYGVSFVVAAVNGALADLIFYIRDARASQDSRTCRKRVAAGVSFAACLVMANLIYGIVQLKRVSVSAGPKIAIFQGDFLYSAYPGDLKGDEDVPEETKMAIYLQMMEAAAPEKPDLYLLPETPWSMYLNKEVRDVHAISRASFAALQRHSVEYDAFIISGTGTYLRMDPSDLAKDRRYNSAAIFSPDGAEPRRYDKRHLVYFGETVPFRFGRLHSLYLLLNRLTPFSGPEGNLEYSLYPGEAFRRFTMTAVSQDDREYRFGIPICYEDVMPYVSREFVSGGAPEKQVDFLFNISNDGWFGRGVQQPQHLSIGVFRAVENRVGIARAVNTGVSGFIQPTGELHDVVVGDKDTPWPRDCGYSVARIGVDPRYTLYSRYGDWFAWGCCIVMLALVFDIGVRRFGRARAARGAEPRG